jgi:hypothetical protein
MCWRTSSSTLRKITGIWRQWIRPWAALWKILLLPVLRKKPHVTIQVLVHDLYLFETDETLLLQIQRTLYSQQKNS